MRAAIYARVSTTRQAANDISLPNQITRCRAYAVAKGWNVVAVFEEPGKSARNDNRPAFRALVDAAERGDFEKIVFFDQSRFVRSAKDCFVYADRLVACNVGFHSVSEDYGEGESARMNMGIRAIIDENNSLAIAKHVARSMEANARLGFWNGSTAPFGFETYVAETRGARVKKKLRVNAAEAEIVRSVFDLYVNGDGKSGPLGVKNIVSRLNARGYRNRPGGLFRVQFVDTILRNTAYVGEHHYGKTDSRRRVLRDPSAWIKFATPVIVDEALFLAAQEKLDRQRPINVAPRLVTSDVLLTQVARCGACGAPMRKHSAKSGRYAYYRCARALESGAAASKARRSPSTNWTTSSCRRSRSMP